MIRIASTTPTTKKGKYQIMPDLTLAEYEVLKASIAERGVDHAPIEDEDGNLLDGWHRERICNELGISYPKREIRLFASEADKLAFVLTVNVKRRRQLEWIERGRQWHAQTEAMPEKVKREDSE